MATTVNCAKGFINAGFASQDAIVLWPTRSLRQSHGCAPHVDYVLAADAHQGKEPVFVPVGYNNDGMVVNSITPQQLDDPGTLWARVIYSPGEMTWYIYPVSSWWFAKKN